MSIIDKAFKRFMQDDFLRQIIARFVICSAILEAHNSFKEPKVLEKIESNHHLKNVFLNVKTNLNCH
jgi:hypothetical protein